MAAANYQSSEDHFLCSICLEVFTDPVSTSCGHNFCKNCITEHWNNSVQYRCPLCKTVFNTRPELLINTFISAIVAQFRNRSQQEAGSSSSEQQAFKSGEVPCDACTGTKLKAQKSCLDCLTSYCEFHLEPHLTASGLRRHQLIEPVENLEDRMCKKHDKPLELFCKTDQNYLCILCPVLDHKTHEFVPLKDEYEEKKAELEETDAQIQKMIQQSHLKIAETKQSVDLSKKGADREIAEGVRVFSALKTSVERDQAKFIKMIKEKQDMREKQAEAFIEELKQVISELTKRSSELEQLSCSKDHLQLLQRVQMLKINEPQHKDWTEATFSPETYEGTAVRAVTVLEETLSQQMKKLLKEAELKRVQQYAVDVTLDPDTANPTLVMSDDGKQVQHGDVWKRFPDNPERFSKCACVLAEQRFSSGRFYFEVQVKGKTEWDLGVIRESINRKEEIILTPEAGSWSIYLRKGNKYKAGAGPPVLLSLKCPPEKVGVYVDYDKGLVCFFDVDSAALIYSFTGCSFNGKIFPYFSPGLNDGGKNSGPLVISPVCVK